MIDGATAMQIVAEALAAESGCSAEDFAAPGVRVVERPTDLSDRPLARRYPARGPAVSLYSTGAGVVVSASRSILPAGERLFSGTDRDRAFALDRLAALSALLAPSGRQPYGPYLRLICSSDTLREARRPDGCRISVEVSPSAERLRALGGTRWLNAISPRQTTPTVGLVLAHQGERLVGLASISAEAERLRQIGIDVVEDCRGSGIGGALTATAARLILEDGRVPWYGVAPSNIASVRTALAAGFRVAWTEVFSGPMGR